MWKKVAGTRTIIISCSRLKIGFLDILFGAVIVVVVVSCLLSFHHRRSALGCSNRVSALNEAPALAPCRRQPLNYTSQEQRSRKATSELESGSLCQDMGVTSTAIRKQWLVHMQRALVTPISSHTKAIILLWFAQPCSTQISTMRASPTRVSRPTVTIDQPSRWVTIASGISIQSIRPTTGCPLKSLRGTSPSCLGARVRNKCRSKI